MPVSSLHDRLEGRVEENSHLSLISFYPHLWVANLDRRKAELHETYGIR